MKLEKIQDFEVWKKAQAFWEAVNAILTRPGFAQNFKLRDQLMNAIDSILSNMSEGFEQPTDRSFARYLYISKGSAAETCTRLGGAHKRGCSTDTELHGFEKQAAELGRMTTGLIKHLLKTPNRERGLGPATGHGCPD